MDDAGPGTTGPSERHGLDAQMAERAAGLEAMRAAGVDPYPYRFERSATAAELHARHTGLPPDTRTGDDERVAGRVTSIRSHGQLTFVTLHDESGDVQLLVQAERASAMAATVVEHLDLGDWIGTEGEVVTSRRGELSLDVTEAWLLAKALRPLPDLHHGLADAETRLRHREVDLIANPETKRVFDTRIRVVAALRQQLQNEGFVEVETPVLQTQAGGAVARPFLTHSNALDMDLSLRIAPELYLKRLVVGGYERVFELGRDFRNEGIDTRHSPEFTALEAYMALADCRDGMDLTERLVVNAAKEATGRLTFRQGDLVLDLTSPWPRRNLLDLVAEVAGRRLHPSMAPAELRPVLDAQGVPWQPEWGAGKLIFELYDKVLEPATVGPVFVWGYPVEVSPLARRSAGDPTLADRFELVIGGRELANGYSELNDPVDQRARFDHEAVLAAAGDVEAHPADQDFVYALEVGLPPTGGIGIGVDRLVMLVAEVAAIRDVILFPLLRPEGPP
jgi:lysyl-tRNA synthetase class 2